MLGVSGQSSLPEKSQDPGRKLSMFLVQRYPRSGVMMQQNKEEELLHTDKQGGGAVT